MALNLRMYLLRYIFSKNTIPIVWTVNDVLRNQYLFGKAIPFFCAIKGYILIGQNHKTVHIDFPRHRWRSTLYVQLSILTNIHTCKKFWNYHQYHSCFLTPSRRTRVFLMKQYATLKYAKYARIGDANAKDASLCVKMRHFSIRTLFYTQSRS